VVIVDAGRFARRTWWIIGVLGQHSVATLQVGTLSFSVHCLDTEHVLMSLFQAVNGDFQLVGFATGDPSLAANFHVLNDVVGDGGATVVLWNLPRGSASVGKDIGIFKLR